MATAGVDFFRVNRSGATRWLLISSVLLVGLGATSIGAHLFHRLRPETAHLVSVAGGVGVLVGLVLGFGTMAMLLFENAYILIREDGVLCHDNGKEVVIAWADLDDVKVADRRFLVFDRKGADPHRWYTGDGAADVRARVIEAKRKGLHGLLKASDPPPRAPPPRA